MVELLYCSVLKISDLSELRIIFEIEILGSHNYRMYLIVISDPLVRASSISDIRLMPLFDMISSCLNWSFSISFSLRVELLFTNARVTTNSEYSVTSD